MKIINISDIRSPELEIYSGLSEPQLKTYYEPKPGLFIAESMMIIQRALDAGYEPVSVLAEDKFLVKNNADVFTGYDIPVYSAPLKELEKVTGFALTRGIMCAMRRKEYSDMESLLSEAKRIVVLERVMNPTNVGAIFRSAAALGMDAVLMTPGCTDPLYRRAARVSMGTVFQIPWTYMKSWPAGLQLLKDSGFKTYAMALKNDTVDLRAVNPGPDEKIALIMGTEGEGLADETIFACDATVKIPMFHGVDSLNVAAASAVAFWQIAGSNISGNE